MPGRPFTLKVMNNLYPSIVTEFGSTLSDWDRNCAQVETRTLTINVPQKILSELPSRLLIKLGSDNRPALFVVLEDPVHEYPLPGALPSVWTQALLRQGDAWVFDITIKNANTLDVKRHFVSYEPPPNLLADFVCLLLIVLLLPSDPPLLVSVATSALVIAPRRLRKIRAAIALSSCIITIVLIAQAQSSAASAVLLSLGAAMTVPYKILN